MKSTKATRQNEGRKARKRGEVGRGEEQGSATGGGGDVFEGVIGGKDLCNGKVTC